MCFMDPWQYMYVLIDVPHVMSLAVTTVWWSNANDVTYDNLDIDEYVDK